MLILRLIDGSDEPLESLGKVQAAIEEVPHVPVLYLIAGKLQSTVGDGQAAAECLRAGLTQSADEDTRTRLLLDLAMLTEEAREKEELLRGAAALGGNLVAAATARIILRSL